MRKNKNDFTEHSLKHFSDDKVSKRDQSLNV